MQHANPTVAILFIGILSMWPTAVSLLPSAQVFNRGFDGVVSMAVEMDQRIQAAEPERLRD